MQEKFKKTEETLYNYKSMEIRIKNIQIDIENLLNDITLKAISYEQKSSKTNAFNSSVENEVIKREENLKKHIDILKAKLKYNKDLKVKIDGALGELNSSEYKLVSLRYFSKEKKTWIAIGSELGFDKDYCVKIKNKIIRKLSELIYP
ncbi:MAG: xanthine dehydrogenase [Clostridium butyricum]|nr:xanthine dehydrogenase [Clostridium butyricum]